MKPCPYCNSKKLELTESYTPRWMHMECVDCGATGPECRSEEKAIELWNNRPIESIIEDIKAMVALSYDCRICKLIEKYINKPG